MLHLDIVSYLNQPGRPAPLMRREVVAYTNTGAEAPAYLPGRRYAAKTMDSLNRCALMRHVDAVRIE